MSSDGKEPGAVWQDPKNTGWDHSFDQAQSLDQDDLPFFFDSHDQGGHPDVSSVPLEEESSANRWGPAAPLLSLLKQFGQYVPIIVLPLLFGGLTSLFILLSPMAERASVPKLGLAIIMAIIITLALAQGLFVYFVGTNNGFRVVFTVAGLFLFMLVGCFTVFGPLPGLALLFLLFVVSIVLLHYSVHPVPEGYVDIVYSFGKYSRTLYRGFNLLMPWERVASQLNIEETQWLCPVQRVQLSGDQDVVLRAILSYQLVAEDAYLAITQINRWEESLQELFITTLQAIVPTFTPDDFLIWPQGFRNPPRISQPLNAFAEGSARWELVNNLLFQQMRDKVAMWGVQINWVSIRDVYLGPHEQVVLPTPDAKAGVEAGDTTTKVGTPAASTPTTQVEAPAQPAKNAPASPKAAQEVPPAASPTTLSPPKTPKEEILIKIYKEVQSGKITDPETIRDIAAKFEAITNDPKASQEVSFDAARAALNLYAQARKYEEQQQGMAPLYSNESRTDLLKSHPASTNNLTPGD